MLSKLAFSAVLTLIPLVGQAQQSTCPTETIQDLHTAVLLAQDGGLAPQAAVDTANQALGPCGRDRLGLSLMMAVLARAGDAVLPPSDERDALFFNALQVAYEIAKSGSVLRYDDERYGTSPVEWDMVDERAVYHGLMKNLANDHYTYGRNTAFYQADQQARFGCGLSPERELAAYSLAPAFDERGELRARVSYLAINCDDATRAVSGHAAMYWESHAMFSYDKEDYGIEASEISRELIRFLDQHLDGASESSLFTADAVSMIRFLHQQ